MPELTETQISSKPIYNGRIINFRVDQVRMPNGAVHPREIVEHRGAIAVVPLLPNGNVVLVRQFRTAAQRVLLEIPAGTRETGEEIEVCARREIVEEIQYEAGKIDKLFHAFVAPGYSQELIHTFLATDLTPKAGKGDDDEFIDVVELPLADAIAMIPTGEIEDGKTIAGLLYVARMQEREEHAAH